MQDMQRSKVVQVFPGFVDTHDNSYYPSVFRNSLALHFPQKHPAAILGDLGDVDFAVLIWFKLVGLGAWFL